MKLRLLYILILGLSVQLSSGQYFSQKKGDYYFSQFAFIKAIDQYQKLLESGRNTDYAHQRLAECYLLIRDFKKSIPHFEKVINSSTIPSDYYFKYAMALHSDGRLDEAGIWLKKYKKYHKNDSRVRRFLKDGNFASVVFNSRERYSLSAVGFNSPESDFGIFSRGEMLYFASSRKDEVKGEAYGWNEEPWLDLFYIKENNPEAKPERIKGDVNTKFHESSLIYTVDYKRDTVIYFTRNSYFNKKAEYGKDNYLNLKIYRAERNRDGEWIVNKSLPINSEDYSTGHPYVSPDGRRLYYTSDRPGGFGGTDIYYSEIHERGRIGPAVNLGPVINTEGNEMFPFINNEGRLFFSSDGHIGFGQLDIFSSISDEQNTIVDVINLGSPINSESDDFAYYAHEDGINGYISSNRDGGLGGDDIYAFKFTPELSVEGVVTDGVNNKVLDSVKIKIFNQKTGELFAEVLTDENGYYRTFINRNMSYMIEAERKTHPKGHVYFNTFTTPLTTKIIRQDIVLEPILDLKILANLNKIYFDFDKSNIRPDAAFELDKVVKLMTITYPDMIIKLEAHTDPVGSHAYNDNLSERRAKSTYEYLIAHGVSKEQIVSYKGYGKRRLINDCTGLKDCTPEKLELNRRTEFPILQIKKNQRLIAKQ